MAPRNRKGITRCKSCRGALVRKSCESDYVLDEAEHGKRKDILFPAIIELV